LDGGFFMKWRFFLIVCGLIVSMPVTSMLGDDSAKTAALPTVPDGFTIETAASSPLVKYPMMAGFDDRGRLFVGSSDGRNQRAADLMKDPSSFVQMLEDTNGDGVFDKSTVFADKMTLPMGALWYRGALYVASPPGIWRLEDTDDDGVADKREMIVNNFGFSGNAASVHGCFLGPCGRIYWCDGRHGHELQDEDGKVTSGGLAARIFSCKPDGSDVQVYCGGGMDNPVEIDFMRTGEMIGTVNILLTRPRDDCLMHWFEGGVYPHYELAYTEFQSTGELLQPMTKLGHVAVSGMTRYRSTHLGEDFQNNIFTTLFNTHKVIRSKITRSGATFATKEEEFLVSENPDFHPTDVLEDADGSLLVIDTGGWFRIGCPVSKVAKPSIHGAIYRIRRKNTEAIDDPRGLKLNLGALDVHNLFTLLDDPRPTVRARAIEALAEISSITKLYPILRNNEGSVQARCNAIWALARRNSKQSRAFIKSALLDSHPDVRTAAARSMGVLQAKGSTSRLQQMVTNDLPTVRREAATALGLILESDLSITRSAPQQTPENIEARKDRPRYPVVVRKVVSTTSPQEPTARNRSAVDAIFKSLARPSTDRSAEHAAIFAVIRIGDPQPVIPYLSNPNPQFRRAALIAMDQMHGDHLTREMVVPLLDTDDPQLQQQALAVISSHEGWASETLGLLQQWISDKEITDERAAILRGFLIAQSTDKVVQKLVADSLASESLSMGARLLLMEVMHGSAVNPLPESWIARLGASLQHSESAVRLQAIRTVASRNLSDFDSELHKLAADDFQSTELRVEALSTIAPRAKTLDPETYRFLRDRLSSTNTPFVQLAAARALSESQLSAGQLIQLAENISILSPLTVPIALRAFSRSEQESVGRALVVGLNEPKLSLNVSSDQLAKVLAKYPTTVQESAKPIFARLNAHLKNERARLSELRSLAKGGDATKGREVFLSKKAACSSCHAVAAQGGRVGPDLTKIGAIRTGGDLLEAIIVPSASFARGFRTYVIATEEGRIHTGIITRQTSDTVYLKTTELSEVRIPRDSIEEMAESKTSIMPKGLEKVLTPEELQNLIAYLRERK